MRTISSEWNAHGCDCFNQGICSSCEMQGCPFFGDISNVHGFGTGGTDMLYSYAAWSVQDGNGKSYVVKFGGSQSHKEQAILTAQFAHSLHVMTPKQILIDSTSCPSLWSQSFSNTHFDDESSKSAFIKSLETTRTCKECEGMPNVGVQEHAGYLRASSEITNIEQSFWYQAGAISAFDWITGKSDLFNDLSLGWNDNIEEDFQAVNTNRHNIHFERRKLVAIDLGINMLSQDSEQWDLWDEMLEMIPGSSSAEELTWVKKVLFPMLAMMSLNGEHGSVTEFGNFKREDLSGWDRHLSPSLTMLGLSKTIHKALEMLSAAEASLKLQQFLGSLTGMQKAMAMGSAYRGRLSRSVQRLDKSVTREITELNEAGLVCCKVTCTRRWTSLGGRSDCTVKSEHKLMKLQSAVGFVNGFLKTVMEEDCYDILSYRFSKNSQKSGTNQKANELLNQHCDCGSGAKEQRFKLTNAPRNSCA